MNNLKIQFDGYTLSVKELGVDYMIAINPRGELHIEFIITDKKDIKVTSLTIDGTPVFCIWYYVPQKLRQAILDGITF